MPVKVGAISVTLIFFFELHEQEEGMVYRESIETQRKRQNQKEIAMEKEVVLIHPCHREIDTSTH